MDTDGEDVELHGEEHGLECLEKSQGTGGAELGLAAELRLGSTRQRRSSQRSEEAGLRGQLGRSSLR